MDSGLDRRVTIALSWAAYILIAIVFAIVVLLARGGRTPMAYQRWLLSFGTAALWAGAIYYSLTIAVPYLPGDTETHPGVVTDVFSAQSRRHTCNEYVTIQSGAG